MDHRIARIARRIASHMARTDIVHLSLPNGGGAAACGAPEGAESHADLDYVTCSECLRMLDELRRRHGWGGVLLKGDGLRPSL